jgi:hypothetical protein
MKTYYLFTVDGHTKMTEMGNLLDNAKITVIAKTEKEALEKAKKLVDKPLYRVGAVTEYILPDEK